MLPSIILFPLSHFLAFSIKLIILFFYIHVFKFINIFDEDTNQKFRKICIFVHWFWILYIFWLFSIVICIITRNNTFSLVSAAFILNFYKTFLYKWILWAWYFYWQKSRVYNFSKTILLFFFRFAIYLLFN
jgi:hypothetical protein